VALQALRRRGRDPSPPEGEANSGLRGRRLLRRMRLRPLCGEPPLPSRRSHDEVLRCHQCDRQVPGGLPSRGGEVRSRLRELPRQIEAGVVASPPPGARYPAKSRRAGRLESKSPGPVVYRFSTAPFQGVGASSTLVGATSGAVRRDLQQRRIRRPTAAISSSVSSSGDPSACPSMTQWRAWPSSRPRATLSRAAWTAEICVMTSMQ
jgi:hypothetical protein